MVNPRTMKKVQIVTLIAMLMAGSFIASCNNANEGISGTWTGSKK